MNHFECPVCGKDYHGRNKNACSMACYAELKQNYKKCAVCGKLFPDPESNDTVTCSLECSKKHRQGLYESGNVVGLDQAHEAFANSPLTGRFETNSQAKNWVIKSPDGVIYECRNLKNWLREHEDLLDGTIEQAFDGISKIKYSAQGKRKNPCYQWKGWTLLEWED